MHKRTLDPWRGALLVSGGAGAADLSVARQIHENQAQRDLELLVSAAETDPATPVTVFELTLEQAVEFGRTFGVLHAPPDKAPQSRQGG